MAAVCRGVGAQDVLVLVGVLFCACSKLTDAKNTHRAGDGEEFVTRFETIHLSEAVQNALHRVRRNLPVHRQKLEFSFTAFQRTFALKLWQHATLLSPGASVAVVDKVGHRTAKFSPSSLYHGQLEGERTSYVHGAIANGTFRGIIHTAGESYHLEPSRIYISHAKHDTIMYKESDVRYPWHAHGNCAANRSERLRSIQESARLLDESHHRQRRAFDDNRKTCQVAIVADHTFFNAIGGDESSTIQEMVFHITEASRLFSRTEFVMPSNGQKVTGINFQVERIVVYSDPNTSPFAGTFGTDEMLEAFSGLEFDDVCLAHLFLHREFDNGVLGLAWVASPSGGVGGICQKRTTTGQGTLNLNTGYTTTLNFGSKVLRSVSTITTTHEFGHNFGSPHDNTAACAPGGNDGNYIMYPSATDGTKPHNTEFSSCSISSISAVLDTKASCFLPYRDKNVCGNGIVEGDEQCDCGVDEETCRQKDPCCKAGNCTLLPGMDCSIVADVCCVKTNGGNNETICKFAPPTHLCRLADECRQPSYCTNGNSSCPAEDLLPDGTLCNQNSSTCVAGLCTGSLCATYGLPDCSCKQEGKECELCCEYQSECNSTFDLHVPNMGIEGVYRGANTPCLNYSGYCPGGTGRCITVDSQKPLDDLKTILDTITLSSIAKWVRENWPATLGGFGGAIALFILLRVTYRPKKIQQDLEESTPLLDRESNH